MDNNAEHGADKSATNPAVQGTQSADDTATRTQNDQAAGGGVSPEANAFMTALPEDTRSWLTKKGLNDPAAIAKAAYEQEKMLGNRIAIPGDDATDEERNAFYAKLGRPETPEGYELKVPENLPENLPYDGERADRFKAEAHKLGLSAAQTAQLHDWFVDENVQSLQSAQDNGIAELGTLAKEERTKLEKVWGPMNSETGKRNAAFADQALDNFPPTFKATLQHKGLLGPNMEVLDADLGIGLATLGAGLFKEDDITTGNPTAIGNPFDEGSPNFNLTKAMQIVKENPKHARTLMLAAGRQPNEFGL